MRRLLEKKLVTIHAQALRCKKVADYSSSKTVSFTNIDILAYSLFSSYVQFRRR
jgi:hypothetical protein